MIASGTTGAAATLSEALGAADGAELGAGAEGTAEATGWAGSADGLSQPQVMNVTSSRDLARGFTARIVARFRPRGSTHPWTANVLYRCMLLPSRLAVGSLLIATLTLAPRLARAETTAARKEPEATGAPKAEEEEGVEHTIVVGAGGDVDVDLGDGSVHGGVNAFVEWNAVPGWLELELGGSVIPADKGVEVPVNLLAKKPFRLTSWSELLVGIGPEVLTVSTPDAKGTYFGAVGALDFMFWPFGARVGLWAAPEYSVVFHDGAQSAVGATGGVLLGW
jgi:hypothetical protein